MDIDLKQTPTYYINMDKDVQKNEMMKVLGKGFGFENYKRISGVDLPDAKKSGCAQSHYKILSKIKKPTIILEDDCVIRNNFTTITVPDDADAVYLGLSQWGFMNSISEPGNYKYEKVEGYKDIFKVDSMLATHAILYISKEYISLSKKIAKYCGENDIHVDTGLASVQKYFNIYAIGHPIFIQDTNQKATDIKLLSNRG